MYLYLSNKNKAVVVELQFTLRLAGNLTEILTYSFGDSAKYEGFGKTLREPLSNSERLSEVTVAAEIQSVVVYKLVAVRVPARLTTNRASQRAARLNYVTNTSSSPSSAAALGFNTTTGSEPFLVSG